VLTGDKFFQLYIIFWMLYRYKAIKFLVSIEPFRRVLELIYKQCVICNMTLCPPSSPAKRENKQESIKRKNKKGIFFQL
jgi:hypothetical protein